MTDAQPSTITTDAFLADLPESVAKAITPLLRALPLERAMPDLVVTSKADQQSVDWVSSMVGREPIEGHGGLIAGLWLYVDLLDYSHRISQSMDEPTGAYWHGIMHRREGDFSNAKYWFHQASGHPAIGAVQSQAPSYDPAGFVDEVERAHRAGEARQDLVETQRIEWAMLFQSCAADV